MSKSVEFLGHVIIPAIKANPKKIEAMKNFPIS